MKVEKRPHQVLNDAAYIVRHGIAQFAVSELPEVYGAHAVKWYQDYRDMIVVNPQNLLITFAVDMDDGTLCNLCTKYQRTMKVLKCNSTEQAARESDRLSMLGFTMLRPKENLQKARSRGDIAGIDYVSAQILFARLGITLY